MRILRIMVLLLIFLLGFAIGQFLPTGKDLHIQQALAACRDWARQAGVPKGKVVCELDIYDSAPLSGVAIIEVTDGFFLESYAGGWLRELGLLSRPLFTSAIQPDDWCAKIEPEAC